MMLGISHSLRLFCQLTRTRGKKRGGCKRPYGRSSIWCGGWGNGKMCKSPGGAWHVGNIAASNMVRWQFALSPTGSSQKIFNYCITRSELLLAVLYFLGRIIHSVMTSTAGVRAPLRLVSLWSTRQDEVHFQSKLDDCTRTCRCTNSNLFTALPMIGEGSKWSVMFWSVLKPRRMIISEICPFLKHNSPAQGCFGATCRGAMSTCAVKRCSGQITTFYVVLNIVSPCMMGLVFLVRKQSLIFSMGLKFFLYNISA